MAGEQRDAGPVQDPAQCPRRPARPCRNPPIFHRAFDPRRRHARCCGGHGERTERSCGRLSLSHPCRRPSQRRERGPLVGWNNLGMHCMDARLLRLLAPAALQHDSRPAHRPAGALWSRDPRPGITVTYEAIADPDGSINTTSPGKTNFWEHVHGALRRVACRSTWAWRGRACPAPANTPQPMTFDAARAWFIAEGIPITPYDDARQQEPLPDDAPGGARRQRAPCSRPPTSSCRSPTRWTARPATPRAAARPRQPAAGWVNDPDPQRDCRLNILRLHDERQADDPTFGAALAGRRLQRRGPLRHRDDRREADPLRQLPPLRGAARQRHSRASRR